MITCIMPTTARRQKLWSAAIATFAAQTVPARLLIGLDRDAEPWQRVQLEGIIARYRVSDRVGIISCNADTLGGKRNVLCYTASTPWIAFWDDDDWHHPDRLAITQAAILRIEAKGHHVKPLILGSRTMLIHEILDERRRTFSYRFAGPELYFVGGMLCFEREVWNRKRFKETGLEATVGDEAWWQLAINPGDVFRHEFTEDAGLYCAFIHKMNTSNRQAPNGDMHWTQLDQPLATLIGAESLALWEGAHRDAAIDRLVEHGDPRDVIGDHGPRV